MVFTYDDYQAGQSSQPYVKPPQHIISLRERRWKIAEYYDANGKVPSQWEMYDLKRDPLERTNLAYKGYKRTPTQERQYRRLRRKLARRERSSACDRCLTLPSHKRKEARAGSRREAPSTSLG